MNNMESSPMSPSHDVSSRYCSLSLPPCITKAFATVAQHYSDFIGLNNVTVNCLQIKETGCCLWLF